MAMYKCIINYLVEIKKNIYISMTCFKSVNFPSIDIFQNHFVLGLVEVNTGTFPFLVNTFPPVMQPSQYRFQYRATCPE
jgi:hypothetical protein